MPEYRRRPVSAMLRPMNPDHPDQHATTCPEIIGQFLESATAKILFGGATALRAQANLCERAAHFLLNSEHCGRARRVRFALTSR